MFFVVDNTRFQQMISIVREDKQARKQRDEIPFLRLKALENELTVSSSIESATLAATVYEPGVLFVRTTKFCRVLKMTSVKEQFVTFQFTEEGFRFCSALLPFDTENMAYFPDVSQAPENWPLTE
jgi:hypothetical protein